jgi:NADH-quinone oxidoreductase subunit L
MMQLSWLIALIPAFPLIGFLLNALFVRNERANGLVASISVVAAFITAIVAVSNLAGLAEESRRLTITLWDWLSVGQLSVSIGLLFDPLTAVMVLLITGVGALIHIYSMSYMHGDARPARYFAYLNLFVFSMLVLVMADNLLLLFLGWEGVGLCSFLLIGHYFDRKSVAPGIVPSEAAAKAFVANRVGDAGLILAMLLIVSYFGTLSFFGADGASGFLDQMANVSFTSVNVGIFGAVGVVSAIGLLMLLGVTGKSAQAPLFVWLPDAMAGPTPVSALIHAATMVTAGVYLIVRTHVVFDLAADAAGWVTIIGALTALIGATAALTQFDIKRVLAYSTISQLGFMIAAAGMGAYTAAIFHLLTHGIFKALLFLGSGAIIHGLHDVQDMRRMGGLSKSMPNVYRIYLIGALALSGIFPFAGFWSKDEILAHGWYFAQDYNVTIMLIISSLLTAFYMGRQIALTFAGEARDEDLHAHEHLGSMKWPLYLLAGGAVLGGILNIPGIHWLHDWLHPVLHEETELFTLSMGIFAAITMILATGSGYLGYWIYSRMNRNQIRAGQEDPAHYYLGDIWKGFEIGWGLDYVYTRFIVKPYRTLSRFMHSVVDKQAIDGVLVEGGAGLIGKLAQFGSQAQNGNVRSYALVFFVGVVIVVGYVVFGA